MERLRLMSHLVGLWKKLKAGPRRGVTAELPKERPEIAVCVVLLVSEFGI